MLKLIKLFCVVVWCVFSAVFGSTAMADSINNVRAFANADKTRVVFDLDYNARFSTALNDGGKTFVIRINKVSNPVSSPISFSVQANSVIKKVLRNIQKNDVRYIFTLENSDKPNVFMLAPQDGYSYRLVVDFPHLKKTAAASNEIRVISQESAQDLKGKNRGAGAYVAQVVTPDKADRAEDALLNKIGKVGDDGIRTLTPAEVQAYEKLLEELREQYAKTPVIEDNSPEESVPEAKAPPPPKVIMSDPDPFIIAVDAGHGGKDPGAIGKRGVREKNVTLAIAQELARYINSNKQFRARLIRSKDVFVDLNRRSEIARRYKADILISIHADSVASGSSARGASVWVLSNNRAKRENRKLLKDSGKSSRLLGGAGEVISDRDQNPYLAATILDMSSDNARSDGYMLGEEILKKLGSFTRLHNRKPIHASLAVLKSPDIPSLLIETGFLSNRYEEIQLNQPNYQKQIAYRIYQGIKTYYAKYPAQRFKSRQESALRASLPERDHVVQKGEYLTKIARHYGVSVSAIRQRNNLKSDTLKVGQLLIIPK